MNTYIKDTIISVAKRTFTVLKRDLLSIPQSNTLLLMFSIGGIPFLPISTIFMLLVAYLSITAYFEYKHLTDESEDK